MRTKNKAFQYGVFFTAILISLKKKLQWKDKYICRVPHFSFCWTKGFYPEQIKRLNLKCLTKFMIFQYQYSVVESILPFKNVWQKRFTPGFRGDPIFPFFFYTFALLLCISKLDTQININHCKPQTHDKSLNNLPVFSTTKRNQQTN
jgi:hypothetical protein